MAIDWLEVNQTDGDCDECGATIPAGDRVRFGDDNLCLACADARRRFDGAVHDGVVVHAGRNRAGDAVVRIDLSYGRGTGPVLNTLILDRATARALHMQLAELGQ